MKQRNWVRMYLIALVLIGLAGALLSNAWLIRMVFVMIAAAGGFALNRLEVSGSLEKARVELDKLQDEGHLEMLQIINHLRHDWMNDIQVLFGYIQLKKYDNLTPYMEKIKLKMQQESLLSKLGIPSLVAYLLAFRVHSRSMQLEVDLEEEINLAQLPVNAGLTAYLVQDTIELFNEYARFEDHDEVGVLSLELDVREDSLLLDYVFQGSYDRDGLEQSVIRKLLRNSGEYVVEEHEFREEEAVLAIRLPYRT